MNPTVKDILTPFMDKLAEESSRHPVYDWGSYEDILGQERFLGFSLCCLCDSIREKEWRREHHSELAIDAFLGEFSKRGFSIREDVMPFAEPCKWYVVSLGNLEYNLRKQQLQILVKIRGNESPGWSSEIMTSPERFADHLIEFDSCIDWLRDVFGGYISARMKQRMIDEIKAVTREALRCKW